MSKFNNLESRRLTFVREVLPYLQELIKDISRKVHFFPALNYLELFGWHVAIWIHTSSRSKKLIKRPSSLSVFIELQLQHTTSKECWACSETHIQFVQSNPYTIWYKLRSHIRGGKILRACGPRSFNTFFNRYIAWKEISGNRKLNFSGLLNERPGFKLTY